MNYVTHTKLSCDHDGECTSEHTVWSEQEAGGGGGVVPARQDLQSSLQSPRPVAAVVIFCLVLGWGGC